jgi:post-segregation antitoxin (ccd killing protein)
MRRLKRAKKRRTTVTLPSDLLERAERIARERRVNLSTAISDALAEGLRADAAGRRAEAVLAAYRKAFQGFSDEEMAILDGVVLERGTKP